MMDHADSPNRGDLDGRGNLSAAALKDFCAWFLSVSLDQIRFTSMMFDLDHLEGRYRSLVRVVVDDNRAPDLLSADRTSVVSGKSVSVRVDLGGCRCITTKKPQ